MRNVDVRDVLVEPISLPLPLSDEVPTRPGPDVQVRIERAVRGPRPAPSDDGRVSRQRRLPSAGGPLSLLVERVSADGARLHVVSAVGTGKTTALEWAERALAETARADPTAPVPLLVRAERLTSGAVDDRLVGLSPVVLLVDGLDEVPPNEAARVSTACARVVGREGVVGALLASRPLVSTPPGFTRLYMAPWTAAELAVFLHADRLARHHDRSDF